MTVNILGDKWTIRISKKENDPKLSYCDGYTDWTTRTIGVIDAEVDNESVQDMDSYRNKVVRHEIVHAFLFASGLANNSGSVDCWAQNEEMVDWFAFNGPKIYEAWRAVGAV